MGSLDTKKIYRIDPDNWTVTWETDAPGNPFGMTVIGDELRVLCGETDEDNRIIRRLVPQEGFDLDFSIPCPDDTGSQLGYDGANMHVSQWYNKRVLKADTRGQVIQEINLPHEPCGQVIVDGIIYALTTDDESANDYYLTRIDPRGDEPIIEDLAHIPFPGRALAFDGTHFWTNHRAANEIVCFTTDS